MKRRKLLCIFLTAAVLISASPFATAVSQEDVDLIGETIVPELELEPEPTQEPSETEPGPLPGDSFFEGEPALPPVSPEPLPADTESPIDNPMETGAPNASDEDSNDPAELEVLPDMLPLETEDVQPEEPPLETESGLPEELPLEPEVTLLPDIHVTVPDTGRVVVNPYGLRVTLDHMDATDQVVCPPMPIVNYSGVPVSVSASAVGTLAVGSEAEFVDMPPAADSCGKEIFLYLEFRESEDGSARVSWEDWFYDAPNQLAVTGREHYKDDVLTLAAGDEQPAYGVFRLFGSTTASYENMWTEEDTVDVTVSFTFRPLESGFPAPRTEEPFAYEESACAETADNDPDGLWE